MALLRNWLLPGILALLLALGGFLLHREWDNGKRLAEKLFAREGELKTVTEEIVRLDEALESLTNERNSLSEKLLAEKEKNDSFEEQIEDISSDAGKIDKLSKN